VATGLTTNREPILDSGKGFSLLSRVRTGSGAHLAPFPVDTAGFSWWVEWLRHEHDHLPFPAEVKNDISSTFTPPYTFMAWTGRN